MKKVILLSIIAIASMYFVNSCEKFNPSMDKNTREASEQLIIESFSSENTDKALNCFCNTSCFWSSCFAKCPVVNGVCTAICVCTDITVFGLPLGSGATCGCATISVGLADDPFVDEENVVHYKNLLKWIEGVNSPKLNYLRAKTKVVIKVSKKGNPIAVSNAINKFFDAIQELSQSEAAIISAEIVKGCKTCSR
ncbi:MAG TPA: hypothetical protein EYG86_09470 [Crocinitomicaceae bacterium]|nr:hypothetical protein [Crocinitomicaceae bacterium]